MPPGPATKIRISPATGPQEVGQVRQLFVEYADSLGVDLSFQDFERELAELPGDYTPPTGRLLLASVEDSLAGCVALRQFEPGVCEMKRLYVRPAFRQTGLGRQLAQHVITEARAIGYRRMLLDTLPTMKTAQKLYRDLGFVTVPAYRFNPIEGTSFMALVL